MNNQKEFILIVGLQGSGKSTYAAKLMEKDPSFTYLSLDEIHKQLHGSYGQNDGADSSEATRQMQQLSKEGKNVIFDATNAKYSKRQHFISIFRSKKYHIKIVYIHTSPELAYERVLQREQKNGHFVHFHHIVKTYIWTNFPLLSEANEVHIITNEVKNDIASNLFKESIPLLQKDPYEWAKKYNELIKNHIPELEEAKGFTQYNRHTLDVFSHLLKTTFNMVQKTDNILLILSALLHDTGKVKTRTFLARYNDDTYEVINYNDCFINKTTDIVQMHPFAGSNKNIIEVNVNEVSIRGSYFGHENVSSKIAYDICIRLGFSENDSLYVANVVQLHMDMPIEPDHKTDDKVTQKWANFRQKCNFFLDDLLLLRQCDAQGK